MKNKKISIWILLHILFVIYSGGSVLSKFAADTRFLSMRFCLLYAGVVAILMLYAVGWQQIIRHIPLATAFANKAITVVWGIVWGFLLFHETITPGKVVGAALVMAGVILYSLPDRNEKEDEEVVAVNGEQ